MSDDKRPLLISCGILKKEIDLISYQTGLPILEGKNAGLGGIKEIIEEAVNRLDQTG
jgi:hypothetical protein